MQDFLNLISFSSGVCFFVFRIAVILLSRRHSNHRRTKTGISVRPPVYTARPKTFDFVWIFHHIAVFVPDAVLFFIGRSLGYPFGNIAAALRVYGSLSATHWVRLWPQSRVWALWLYIAAAVIFLAGLIGAVFLPTDSHRTAATCTIVTIICVWSVGEAVAKIRETKGIMSQQALWKWYVLLVASAFPIVGAWAAWSLPYELHLPILCFPCYLVELAWLICLGETMCLCALCVPTLSRPGTNRQGNADLDLYPGPREELDFICVGLSSTATLVPESLSDRSCSGNAASVR
ncbi:hypothetical protein VTK26DRAFT_4588 [Humicola hyalothermophila]